MKCEWNGLLILLMCISTTNLCFSHGICLREDVALVNGL